MHVVIDVAGQIVVDHVSDVRNVESTSGNVSGNQHRCAPSSEGPQCCFTLSLTAISVNGGSRQSIVHQVVFQGIRTFFGLHKDQRQPLLHRLHQVQQHLTLVRRRHILHHLHDQISGRTHTTHRQEDVVMHEIRGQTLNLLGEGGGEQQGLTFTRAGHVLTLHDAPDLRFESHVQHTISLIQSQVSHAFQTHTGSVHDVDETAGRGHQKVAPTLQFTQLLHLGGTSVDHHRANAGLVGEFTGFVVDLRGQLAGGG